DERNPKSEGRNPKETRIPKTEGNPNTRSSRAEISPKPEFRSPNETRTPNGQHVNSRVRARRVFGFSHSDFLRISEFGFRASFVIRQSSFVIIRTDFVFHSFVACLSCSHGSCSHPGRWVQPVAQLAGIGPGQGPPFGRRPR